MTRNSLPIRVAAIHDLSGFGRCSLNVIIPVLSSMGIEVCPLVTAVLSAHSGFPGFRMRDLTDDIQGTVDHWKELGLEFAGIYSGFLGSDRQSAIVRDMIQTFRKPDQIVVVDPVLGDAGKVYTPFKNSRMVEEMRRLTTLADVITPNLTEAALLCGTPYSPDVSFIDIKKMARQLADMGPARIVITSVPDGPGRTSVLAYERDASRFWKVGCTYVPAQYSGTGDTFASVLTGALLQGDSLPVALDRAVQFVSLCVRHTFGHESLGGIRLEKALPSLNAPVQQMTYELSE